MGQCVSHVERAAPFRFNPDAYESWEHLQADLDSALPEVVQQVVYIDATQSNLKQGMRSFQNRPLHHPYLAAAAPPAYHAPPAELNPYEWVLTTITRPLQKYDIDRFIPAYLFGDERSRDYRLTPLVDAPLKDARVVGLERILDEYRAALPRTQLYGPTSFAPALWNAIEWTQRTGEYHIALILTDGCVSEQCRDDTRAAIVEASQHPLSIVIFGVGDGDVTDPRNPWKLMVEFDDALPQRRFDNVQFVPVELQRSLCAHARVPECAFAVQALMEIPQQWEYIRREIMPTYRARPDYRHPRLGLHE